MSDDLVKRLRDEVILERFEGGHVSQMRNPDGPEAADRIETLEAALRDIIEQGDDDFPSPKDMIWTARKALEGKDG
jgi:hypothetical protein